MSSAHNHDASHGSVSSYAIGFVLSVILTVIPFWMVMSGDFERATTLITISVFAVVQILVHLKYFLHLNFTEEGRLNALSCAFAIVVIVLVVGLSLWIMFSANDLMMP